MPTPAASSASIFAGGLGLPERDYYTRTDAKSVEQRQQYVEHVAKMFTLAGEPQSQAAQDAATVLAIETRLAKASLTITEQRDPQNLNHPMDIAAFGKQLTHFKLATYDTAAHAPTDGSMNDTEPKFFAEFNTILADTPLDQIKTYLRWHLLHAYAGTVDAGSLRPGKLAFLCAHSERRGKGAGTLETLHQPRRSRDGRGAGPGVCGQVFSARRQAARRQAMTLAIEQAMGKDIQSLDWMSPETKAKAEEKLHAVMNKIGYPDKWRDYSKLEIVRGEALGNQERVREFDFDRDMAKIGKPVDKDEWEMSPPTVNAYYDPQQNNVNFPAGYFQPPFFSDKEDDAANYGDMGSTIGHELTHGFDDEGRQYDKDGNLRDWWTKSDGAEFQPARRMHGEAVRRHRGRSRRASERQAHAGRKPRRPRRTLDRVARVARQGRSPASWT